MESNTRIESMLRCLMQMTAKASIPMAEIQAVVGNRPNQVKAYNLLDGSRSLSEIARRTGLASSNLARTARRWVKEGVAFKIGTGAESRFLHAYPIRARRT